MVVSQAEMKNGEWVQGGETYEGDLQVDLWKRSYLLQLCICSQKEILQYSTRVQIA